MLINRHSSSMSVASRLLPLLKGHQIFIVGLFDMHFMLRESGYFWHSCLRTIVILHNLRLLTRNIRK